MIIERLDTFTLRIPFTDGSSGDGLFPGRWTHLDLLLVRLATREGLVGWGEGFAYFCAPAVASMVASAYAPLLLGRQVPGDVAWRAGRPTLNGWLAIPDDVSAEAMAACGWDSLTIDLQHGLADQADVLPLLQAMHGWPVTPLVRVPALDPGAIMKVLDLGAYGVICPLIDTPAQAAELVAACRYPPHGRRSFGPVRAALSIGGDYARRADAEILSFAMIETREGLERVEDICAVEGLSGIYIGPADLSLALGVAPGFDPEAPVVVEAMTRIIRCARAAGRWVGVHNATPAYARRMVALGANLVTVGSDLRLLASAAAATVAAFHAPEAARG